MEINYFDKYRENFAKYFKVARSNASFTIEQTAKILKVSTRTVQQWENGEKLPHTEMLLKISDSLGTSVDYLLKGYEDGYSSKERFLIEAYRKNEDRQAEVESLLGVARSEKKVKSCAHVVYDDYWEKRFSAENNNKKIDTEFEYASALREDREPNIPVSDKIRLDCLTNGTSSFIEKCKDSADGNDCYEISENTYFKYCEVPPSKVKKVKTDEEIDDEVKAIIEGVNK